MSAIGGAPRGLQIWSTGGPLSRVPLIMLRLLAAVKPARARTALRLATASLTAATAFVAPPPAQARQASDRPGAELRVWLVTAAPGDAVWERYGHNAIRVLDTSTGRDVSYNWGIFDFQQVDFIPRFLQGRMLYSMAPFRTDAMIESYRRANREVVLQELDLEPSQKLVLRDMAERNALPDRRDYTYQYFRDNCSTRVRDLLDVVLDGALREAFEPMQRGATYRFHTRRLTQVDPLVYTGMDLLLGPGTDAPVSAWDEMFIPMVLRDEIRDLRVRPFGGQERPLVLSEEVVTSSTRPAEPTSPPGWLWIHALIGVALGATLASGATERVRSSRPLRLGVGAVAVAWSVLGGVLGLILVGLLFTDHVFSYWNENLFLANPLLLGLAVLLPLSALGEVWKVRARRLALALAGIAVAGFVLQFVPFWPFSGHRNAMAWALMLPAHLGLAWALARRAPGPAGDRPAQPGIMATHASGA